jgi:glycosyltransferase involved in cell wall biosynthesis
MRILLVSDYATPTGGAELMVLSLRDGLRQRGHEARLFASSARPLGAASAADYECFGTTSSLRGLTQIANPSAFLRLRSVLRDFRPDVVHVRLFLSQLSPAILPPLGDIPAILHVAWYRPICPIGTKLLPDGTSCHEPAGKACLKHGCFPAWAWPSAMLQLNIWRHWSHVFDGIVANSETMRRRLEHAGIGPAEVIWNGVPQRPARPPLTGPPVVAFAGRLVREKGADVLLDAFAKIVRRIPEAQLLIAGAGPERIRLESQISRLHLSNSVRMLGHLSRENLESHFGEAWVQVVPSRWEEPFGIAAAEALMRGTAVVATNHGGLAEFIHHGETGLLVAPGDAEALAEALLFLFADRDRAESMGRCGRQFALSHLTEDSFVGRFLGVYSQIAAGQPVLVPAI